MVDPQVAQLLKERIGITDADLAKVGERVQRLMKMRPMLLQHQLVAEVTQAKYCMAGVQEGQKLVFNCAPLSLDAKASDCPLCLRAFGPVIEPVTILRELFLAGIPPEKLPTRGAECLDPGLDAGGLGHVRFKVYLQKKP